MKIQIALLMILSLAVPALADIGLDSATQIAQQALGTTDVVLDQQSPRSYFFLDGAGPVGDQDHPCIYGVLIDRESGKIVTPGEQQDDEIQTSFPYSDTHVEAETRLIVNCAD